MPEQQPRAKLSHDDYCRIFGRVIFDAFYRIENLEGGIPALHDSFSSQIAALREQLADAREEIGRLRTGGQGDGTVGTRDPHPQNPLG